MCSSRFLIVMLATALHASTASIATQEALVPQAGPAPSVTNCLVTACDHHNKERCDLPASLAELGRPFGLPAVSTTLPSTMATSKDSRSPDAATLSTSFSNPQNDTSQVIPSIHDSLSDAGDRLPTR